MTKCNTYIYKLLYFILLCINLLTARTYAQQNDLSIKANELIYSNPDEAIKIIQHILKISQNPQEVATANLLISKSYLVKGNYSKAIEHAFDNKNLEADIPLKTQIELNILKSELLRNLYLDRQSQEYLRVAEKLASDTHKTENLDSLYSHITLERISMLIDRRENNEAIVAIEDFEIQNDTFLKNNLNYKRRFHLVKERAYSGLSKLDSAVVYMEKTLALADSTQMSNLYEKAIIYKELGHLHLQKKVFKDSEEALFIALRFAEIIDNPILLMHINRDLAINYLATNQKSKYNVYNDEFLILNNRVELLEQEAINNIYNSLANQEDAIIAAEEMKHQYYQYLLLAAVLFILVVGAFVLLKSQGRKKRLREIIKYLEISRSHFTNISPPKKTNKKRIVIPEATEKTILSKLKRFENSTKFLSKDMSLAVLSGKFDTNTKYLSEIINKHYNANFNTFINKLRVNYIIDKLKNDPNYINYKISFLAEESGYSSHSSFATVFKSIVGMSPATFIGLINEERNEIKLKKQQDEN